MSAQCYPMTVLPHISKLYGDYLAMADAPADAKVRQWFGSEPATGAWMGRPVAVSHTEALAGVLSSQSRKFEAGAAALHNIEKLRAGARAVVTGQQVGLFGGPLLTLLKAATAIARATEATLRTGIDHVPVFWLATEDHDLEEVDQVSLPGKNLLDIIKLGLTSPITPVGSLTVDGGTEQGRAALEAALDRASELLGWAPVAEQLRQCYAPGATLGSAFAKFMAALFSEHGLIVMDAASADFHSLGASTLAFAIEHAEELETALLQRTSELEAAGYHAQVLVAPGHSLLFLLHETSGERQALRRTGQDTWKSGGRTFTTAELLDILATSPDRISPNALLRPVFQDTILPVAAYVGGPAEIAYFAQSEVVYRAILGRVTPVLPRFSATLIEPAIATVMDQHEVELLDIFKAKTAEVLAQRLGARAMPIEGKRKLAAVGNAMDAELSALTEYLGAMDASLGRSAVISGNKMRYQMNRLRRMAATFELQKESSLRKHAEALVLQLFPDGHPQERVLGGAWFLSRYGDGLIDRLVVEAGKMCVGHTVVRL
jgi:bacillithiol biosynthesis cysteine-adding enzyme BshC